MLESTERALCYVRRYTLLPQLPQLPQGFKLLPDISLRDSRGALKNSNLKVLKHSTDSHKTVTEMMQRRRSLQKC